METTVVDEGGSIKITHGGEEYSIEKGGGIRIETDRNDIIFSLGEPFLRIVFSAFTTPVFTSAKDGRAQIIAFLAAGGTTPIEHTETQLTAAGSTAARSSKPHKLITFQVKATNVDTNAVIRFEGTLDDTGDDNWGNLDEDNVDTTLTADGTTLYTFTGKLSRVRFTFVSESGGTAVTFDVKIMIGD